VKFAAIDTCVVTAMASGYVLLEACHVSKRWSYLAIGLVFVLYVAYLLRRRTPSLHELGFRTDNIRTGLLPIGGFTLLGSLGLVASTVFRGIRPSATGILVLLALYPVFAVVQQTAFQGLLDRSLMSLTPSATLQVLFTGTAFAAVHVGNNLLVALTFVAGIIWSLLYRIWPNIWLLSASHTLLASLAYPLVLGDAPLTRF